MMPFISEKKIGNTVFTVTSECSPTATETVEQKLERIICRHAAEIRNHSTECKSAAMCAAGSLSMAGSAN